VIYHKGVPVDANQELRDSAQFAAELSDSANRPIFSSYGSYIGTGAIAGIVVGSEKTGQIIGNLLAGTYDPVLSMTSVLADYPTLKRWNISRDALPSDAILVNRPMQIWEDAKFLIRAGSLAGITLLIMILGFAIRSRTDRLKAKLAESHAQQLVEERRKSDTLYGVIAHELRTPVSALSMMARAEDTTDLDSFKKDVDQCAADLILTIDDMSLMVNHKAMRPVRMASYTITSLNTEISKRVAPLVASAGTRFDVNIASVADDIDQVFQTDTYRLRIAIINLIRNACLHSQGQNIRLVTDIMKDHTGERLIQWKVCDNGVGIDPNNAEKLFNVGERGHTLASGSGLGLFISKNWIEEIGGSLTYSPSEGGGSCFTITLPLIEKIQTAPEKSSVRPLSELDIARLRVLYVEDEAMLRLLGQKLMGNLVSEVVVARDGAEALLKFDDQIDLVLTDYFMPELDGVGLTIKLREKGYSGPIIGVTAATIGDQMNQLLDAGADLAIAKPLTRESFIVAVNSVANKLE